MELSTKDIKTLRQLRNRLNSNLTMLRNDLTELDALLERADGTSEPQPRKRANLKEVRKQDALNYLLGKRKTA